MKKLLKFTLGLGVILAIVFFLGPKPAKPNFVSPKTSLPTNLTDLENKINVEEQAVKGIKKDNEAKIIWADSSKKQKTPIALLYLHGFSATEMEGDPVHRDLARKYHANLFLSRLSEHGIDLGDSTMINFNANDYIASAEKALDIAKQLGNEVIIIGTSAGGALSTYLASKHPEIKAIVLYSPCIKIFDDNAELLDNNWGLQIGRLANGGDCRTIKPKNENQPKYWTMHYRMEALVGLQNFLTNAMLPETFAQIKCPTFLAYYYKNEEEQDKVVSVAAMLKMYDELGTPANMKQKMEFPKAGNHVIASSILSNDWQGVEAETDKFLSKIIVLQ